ncbi:MAG: hypothetical protein MJE68_24365, partial [Proteobacteria bacterium]|nr:hypothetical protein [Pseudomonadota bacterium]
CGAIMGPTLSELLEKSKSFSNSEENRRLRMPLPTFFQAKVSSGGSSHNMQLILVVCGKLQSKA